MTNGKNWAETYLNEEGKWDNGSKEKEDIFFDKIAIQIRKAVYQYNESNQGAKRVNHAKIIAGFTRAKFKVDDITGLPEDLRYGFLVPGAEYETIVRLSNAAGKCIADDSSPDLRGIALRLKATGRDYDLLMTNAEIHHASTAAEAMFAINAGAENEKLSKTIPADAPGKESIFGAHYLDYVVKKAGAASGVRIANTLHGQTTLKVQSLSTETFWSRAPYAIGKESSPGNSVAVKFRLRPAKEKAAQENITAVKNLQDEFAKDLMDNDIVFDFEIQRYLNPADTPIENSTKGWITPFEKIAELIIPRGTAFENDTVDKLSFSPWNVDTNYFRPLGNMNRSRQKVYNAGWHERTQESPQKKPKETDLPLSVMPVLQNRCPHSSTA